MRQNVAVTQRMGLHLRRREMQCPHIVEVSVSETIGRLSAKYRVSKRDLWEDWQKRIRWVYDVFYLELAQALRSTYEMTYATVAEYPLISQSIAPRSCRTETQE